MVCIFLLFFANDAHFVCAGGCCEGGGYSLICTLLCMLWSAAKRKNLVAGIVFKLMSNEDVYARFGVYCTGIFYLWACRVWGVTKAVSMIASYQSCFTDCPENRGNSCINLKDTQMYVAVCKNAFV